MRLGFSSNQQAIKRKGDQHHPMIVPHIGSAVPFSYRAELAHSSLLGHVGQVLDLVGDRQ